MAVTFGLLPFATDSHHIAAYAPDLHIYSAFSMENAAISVNLPGCLSDRVKRPTAVRSRHWG